jgi:BNR repeat-containing family member
LRQILKHTYYIVLLLLSLFLCGCSALKIKETTIGQGWSNNSVNTVIFRNSAITTHKGIQFTAYYNPDSFMVLGKRKIGSQNWELLTTQYKGNVKDAHNDISIAVDSQGYLHVSWDHHDTRLRYARGDAPLSLKLGNELPMTGIQEEKVTYPEFHNLPDGSLLFCYRSGASGRGNMVLNRYLPATQKWEQVQDNLLNGEGQRSAYWQMCVGKKGIYLSWVWRESWDVSTNHDICYAFSPDGGTTWQRSDRTAYELPITVKSAEVVWQVPQNSSLINQTAITVDEQDNPYIASYWDNNGVPQYKVVFFNGSTWDMMNTNFHKNTFMLGGGGTKRIPISRPEIIAKDKKVYLLFRDEERGNRISMAYTTVGKPDWQIVDLTTESVGQWEPNFDKELMAATGRLHIFSQNVSQADGEGLSNVPPQPVKVIEIKRVP